MTTQEITRLERSARYTVEFDDGEPDLTEDKVLYALHMIVRDMPEEDQNKARAVVAKENNYRIEYIDLYDVRNYVYYRMDEPRTWITKAGKLPKRISKAFHDLFGSKVNAAQLANIGEQLQRVVKKHGIHYIDTTQDFSWRAGDFGDDHSCFWSSRLGARDMILDLGGFAIRAYEDDTYNEGKARAWIIPVDRDGVETYYLFNTYGKERMEYFCNLIAKITGYQYKSVTLTNNGDDCGTLYINSNSGYCLYPAGVNVPDDYDFAGDDVHYETCWNCGDRVDDDDVYYDDGGRVYCSDCYYERYARCEECDDEIYRDDAIEVQAEYTDYNGRTRTRTVTYCERCASKKGYAKCEFCEEWKQDITGDDDHIVCMNCYDTKGYARCEDCECIVVFNNGIDAPEAHVHGDHTYCEDCYNEHKDTCPDCGAPSENWEQCADCHSAEVRRREGWIEPDLFTVMLAYHNETNGVDLPAEYQIA